MRNYLDKNKSGNIRLGFWIILGIVTLSFFSVFSLKILVTEDSIKDSLPLQSSAVIASAPEIVRDFYFNKSPNTPLKVSAVAYLVGDLDTGEIILAKNKDQKFPLASVSKLMTAIVVDEVINKEENTLVSRRALSTYGGNGGFRANEKVNIGDLLYPLLLESSNDAAEILAEHTGRDIFVGKMNQEAKILGLDQTFYDDPSGLSALNQSSAYDLFRLAGFLKKEKPTLLGITTKRSYSDGKHNWSSNNQFLREIGYMGGKSGYTDPAKETALSVFSLPLGEVGNRSVGIALLQSKDRYLDVQKILQYLKKNIYYGGESDANLAWVKQRDGIPEIREPDFVSVAFLGDIMLDRGVRSSVVGNFGGDYSALFEKLGVLKKSEIVFANLEGPVSDKGSDIGNLYSFRMSPSALPALKGAGVSIVSFANNHVGDFGHEAFVDTLSRLKENEILYTGAGYTTAEAEMPTIIEKYGMKIGFLGFSDVGPEWMKVKSEEAGILLADNPRFDEIIWKASTMVDHLIVSIHFGDEYQKTHNARQEYLAHKAIDNGAKVVMGHHPHVIQDTEIYKDGFIAYSLGNFIFDQTFSSDTMEGMLLNLKLWRDGSIHATKNVIELNNVFQPIKITPGKEEKLKLETPLISE